MQPGGSRPVEIFRALGVLAEPPAPGHERLGALLGLPGRPDPADHTWLFGLNLYPYASVYLGAEGMLGGEARDRVAGFWRALGHVPPAEPDHLSSLLGLFAALSEESTGPPATARHEPEREASRRLRNESGRALLREHLLPWLVPWLERAAELGSPFYRAWAATLEEALCAEARLAGPPDRLPLHLRAAPGPPDPGSGPEGFVAGLLAPVRTGMILTRADLARAAADLGLGLRPGTRVFGLRALLSQEPTGTLRWLAAECARQGERHRAREPEPDPIARFWAERATATAALLEELAVDELRGGTRWEKVET